MAWIPQSENIYFDSLEFLSQEPVEFNSKFGNKVQILEQRRFRKFFATTQSSILLLKMEAFIPGEMTETKLVSWAWATTITSQRR